MTKLFWSVLFMMVVGALFIGGCARRTTTTTTETTEQPTTTTTTAPSTAPSGAREVTVTLNNNGIQVQPNSIPAGNTTFHVVNSSSKTESLQVKGQGMTQKTNALNPGESTDMQVQQLNAGTYTLTVPEATGAAAKQMTGTLTVTQSKTGMAPSGTQEVTVTLNSNSIQISPKSIPAGTATIHVVNSSSKAESLQIKGQGMTQKTNTLNPGESTDMQIQQLKAGKYTLTVPEATGAAAKQMTGTLTVTQAATSTGAASSGANTVTVTLTNNGIQVQPKTVPAGTTTLHVMNSTSSAKTLQIKGQGMTQTTKSLNPNASTDMQIQQLNAGTYTLSVPGATGAAAQNMTATLTVTQSGGSSGTRSPQ